MTKKGPVTLNLSAYERPDVSNVGEGRELFNDGLRLMLSFQHQFAIEYFMECIDESPNCALAYAFLAYCHCPNYNFKGIPYYEFSRPADDDNDEDHINVDRDGTKEESINSKFPCQNVAHRYAKLAIQIVENLEITKKPSHGKEKHVFGHHVTSRIKRAFGGGFRKSNDHLEPNDEAISNIERKLISAIGVLTSNPRADPSEGEELNDRPFMESMRELYREFPNDPEVVYIYAASIMTLHAWKLYEYPTGRPLSEDVPLVKNILEKALETHPKHAGLCHMYCHLCEMSNNPENALAAAEVLRKVFPDAGHLVHMGTHIDVLVGDYEACVRWNAAAIEADKRIMGISPNTSNPASFYFGYIVHDFHMLIYGCILGAFEKIAMDVAEDLNLYVNEELFKQRPDLTPYLETYGAMDIHILVRFGRWQEILQLKFPINHDTMLYRTAMLYYARAVAYANSGATVQAREEANCYEKLRMNPEAKNRILHNNNVADLLEVDYAMMKGEILYFEGKHQVAFDELRKAVQLQDMLNYDEPWGKMQPVRHALGGLLLKHGLVDEAEDTFRADLKRHPKNPWGLIGLISCLKQQLDDSSLDKLCCQSTENEIDQAFKSNSALTDGQREEKAEEVQELESQLTEQRQSEWADYEIVHACACCY